MSIANTGIAQWIASVCSSFHIVSSSRTILAYRFCFFLIVSTLPSHRTPSALSMCMSWPTFVYVSTADFRLQFHPDGTNMLCVRIEWEWRQINKTKISKRRRRNWKTTKEWNDAEMKRDTKNNNLNPLSYVLCIYWSGDGVDRCLCICSLLLLRQ